MFEYPRWHQIFFQKEEKVFLVVGPWITSVFILVWYCWSETTYWRSKLVLELVMSFQKDCFHPRIILQERNYFWSRYDWCPHLLKMLSNTSFQKGGRTFKSILSSESYYFFFKPEVFLNVLFYSEMMCSEIGRFSYLILF